MQDPLHPDKPSGCCAPNAERSAATQTSTPPARNIATEATRTNMIALPGGTFLMGTDIAEGFPQDGEGPVRPVTLAPFLIDRTPVTNDRFALFIAATNYRTEAETFGWSFVFWKHIPKQRYNELVADTVAAVPWWCKVPGACWNAPEGPGSDTSNRGDHPVVHVSWNDAAAYAAWSGLRLPNEAEWEYAARGGLEQKLYPWGDKLRPNGEHRCNIWQGDFPNEDTADDGYAGTSPVEAFPPNGFGLDSITGNTWEWCADWFGTGPDRATGRERLTGPATGEARLMKGGSFLCHKSYCNRYRVAARTSNTPDSSTSNIGFRCAL
jgi:formylglycine-generating enzyme required for sulfatase activity